MSSTFKQPLHFKFSISPSRFRKLLKYFKGTYQGRVVQSWVKVI